MSSLSRTRSEILDNLLDVHKNGRLTWLPREGENSFETNIGEYTFHIDRKSINGKVIYRIWVFNDQGEDIDNFDTSLLSEYTPDDVDFSDYFKVAQFLYKDVKDGLTLEKLSPALEKLKLFGK
jgi:hypothetical protein